MTTRFLTGESLWDRIQALTGPKSGSLSCAIAFLGVDAPDLLALKRGDVLVVNASANALGQGATDPEAMAAFIERGVRVYSSDHLHAKVIAGPRAAIVGSMNASATSRSRLNEAAVVTTEVAAVRAAKTFVDGLPGLTEVDQDFLKIARQLWHPPHGGGGGSKPGRRGTKSLIGVYVFRTEYTDPPRSVAEILKRERRPMRRKAGPASRYELDETWSRMDTAKAGDWLLADDLVDDQPTTFCRPRSFWQQCQREEGGSSTSGEGTSSCKRRAFAKSS
jgi:hypothetical protein